MLYIFAVPLIMVLSMLYYNKDVLKVAGGKFLMEVTGPEELFCQLIEKVACFHRFRQKMKAISNLVTPPNLVV
ncbi:hypothetical protein GCM10026983_44350 [Gracilibacillus alcaliphilus]